MNKLTIQFAKYKNKEITEKLNRTYGHNGVKKETRVLHNIITAIRNDKSDVNKYDKCLDIYSDENIMGNEFLIVDRLCKAFDGVIDENRDTVIRFGLFENKGRLYVRVYSYDGVYVLSSNLLKSLNNDVMSYVAGRFRFNYFEING